MAVTHTLTLAWTRNGETINNSVAIMPEGEQNLDIPVPAPSTNLQVALTIDVSALSIVYVSTDQTVTLKTNSSGSPDETITLTAGKPIIWYTGCGWTNPFGHDLTAIYITRGSGAAATVKFRYGYDATP
jgi:hypothetical protein